MSLTDEEKLILEKAKKIEKEALGLQEAVSDDSNVESNQITITGFDNKGERLEKSLGVAGSVVLGQLSIANFTGRSLLDNKAGVNISNVDELKFLKNEIAYLKELLTGGE